ncbi:hypothetical protein WA158_006582 [Blastocystis sp. Blastoise]
MSSNSGATSPITGAGYKIHVIGNSAVGKSSIINRYMKDSFNTDFITTVGVDYSFKDITIDGQNVRVEVTDTAGQERYRAIAKAYLRNLDGILIVFDVTIMSSFKDIRMWMKQIEENSPEGVPKVLVGNKVDLPERQVTKEEAENFAESVEIPYIEVSAKENININETFEKIARLIMKKKSEPVKEENEKQEAEIVEIGKKTKEDKKCC